LVGLLFGFGTAVISGTINFIQPYFGLSEAKLYWVFSSLLFGCIAGIIIAGKSGDHYDRKKLLILAALLVFFQPSVVHQLIRFTPFWWRGFRVVSLLVVPPFFYPCILQC
jgi:MFS family permease